jgi:PPK2 family polyphosphate:nucleotide phosphotransferase
MKGKDYSAPFRVAKGKKFRLRDCETAMPKGLLSRQQAGEILQSGLERLSKLQGKLYADDRWAVLLIFQAMDAAGKDSTIKHVMSGVNPMGCQVYSFKSPSAEELDHDFLWRTTRCLPERGRIGIFNRSYYEEVLAVRVHPEFLQAEKLPHTSTHIWKERFEDINAHELHLTRNGTVVLKFFLNLSRGEQKKRFLARLERPEKNWKFSSADTKEREHWDQYMTAYEEMIRKTATPHAPWYVVPADTKPFTRLVVCEAITAAMESLDLRYPKPELTQQNELEQARKELSADKS